MKPLLGSAWVHVSAYAGQVRMAYESETPGTEYYVMSGSDTLAAFPGRGTDAFGKMRCYSVPVESSYNVFTCLALDESGRLTNSEDFTWAGDDGPWAALSALDEHLMADVYAHEWPNPPLTPWPPNDHRLEWLEEYEAWRDTTDVESVEVGSGVQELVIEQESGGNRDCEDCADYVVFSSGCVEEDAGLHVAFQLIQATGGTKRARVFHGGPCWPQDPTLPQQYLREIWEANVDSGGGYWPVDPGPTLVLIDRSDETYLYLQVPEGTAPCFDYCYSYNLIADIDGEDRRPDCPVIVIPGRQLEDVDAACTSAFQWNAGIDVIDSRALLLLDDWDPDPPNPGQQTMRFEDDMIRTRNMYLASGFPAVRLMHESDYRPWDPLPGEYDPAVIACAQAFGFGTRDVWAFGHGTNQEILTQLLTWKSFSFPGLEKDQVIMVFAPDCFTGALHRSFHVDAVARSFLKEANGTRAAGFLGQLNDAYEDANEAFFTVFRNELGNAQTGETFDLIVHRAVQTIQEQYPTYGLGVVWFGALTMKRGTLLGPAAVEEPASADAARPMRVEVRDGGVDLHFTLGAGEEIDLDVFDSAGRHVAHITGGYLAPGAYTYTWFYRDSKGRPVGNGVYFARLAERRSKNAPQTARIIVVQ